MLLFRHQSKLKAAVGETKKCRLANPVESVDSTYAALGSRPKIWLPVFFSALQNTHTRKWLYCEHMNILKYQHQIYSLRLTASYSRLHLLSSVALKDYSTWACIRRWPIQTLWLSSVVLFSVHSALHHMAIQLQRECQPETGRCPHAGWVLQSFFSRNWGQWKHSISDMGTSKCCLTPFEIWELQGAAQCHNGQKPPFL